MATPMKTELQCFKSLSNPHPLTVFSSWTIDHQTPVGRYFVSSIWLLSRLPGLLSTNTPVATTTDVMTLGLLHDQLQPSSLQRGSSIAQKPRQISGRYCVYALYVELVIDGFGALVESLACTVSGCGALGASEVKCWWVEVGGGGWR